LSVSEHEGTVIQLQVFTCRTWKNLNECTVTPCFSTETPASLCLWLQVWVCCLQSNMYYMP